MTLSPRENKLDTEASIVARPRRSETQNVVRSAVNFLQVRQRRFVDVSEFFGPVVNVRSHHRVEGWWIERSWAWSKQSLLADMHGDGLRVTRISNTCHYSDQIQKDLVTAMKARDEARLSTVRMMKTALQKAHVDAPEAAGRRGRAADSEDSREAADRRRGNVPQRRPRGLALKEESERKIIESYLPAAASEEEIDAAIDAAIAETGATSAKQMGLVMKAAQAKLAGKTIDGKVLSEKVKARLA